MAGLEELVVQEIVNDMQSQMAQQPPAPIQPATAQISQPGLPPGAVSDPRAPQGFTIADPRLRDQYAESTGRQNAAVATGNSIEAAMRERDKAKMSIMQGLRGLDPQIQGVILKRLGIDPGQVQSEIQQRMQLAQFQNQLQQPQRDAENQIRMLIASLQNQRGEEELDLKRKAQEEATAGRADARELQFMRVLASIMQTSPQLQQSLGPILMQMLQQKGINLAPSGNRTSGRGNRTYQRGQLKITEE